MVISSLSVVLEALFHCADSMISAALGLCVISAVWDSMPPRFRHASLLCFIFNHFSFLFKFLMCVLALLSTLIFNTNRKFRALFRGIFIIKSIADGEQSAAPGCSSPAAGGEINPRTPNFNTKTLILGEIPR